MSDYSTLKDFLVYGKKNFPAERYLLSIGNHGGGWKGACFDHTNSDGFLTMDEFQKALDEVGGVDIICFTPCSMGALESAYELRNCTDIYIGNEAGGDYSFWRFMTGDLCTLLNENPDISNVDLGKNIIRLMKKNFIDIFLQEYPGVSREMRIQCFKWFRVLISTNAVDTSNMEQIGKSVDQLARDLSLEIPNKSFRIKMIRILTQSFYPKFFKLYDEDIICDKIDILDFAKKCHTFFFFDKEIRSDARELMNNINNAVIATFHSIYLPQARSLTIYFPSKINVYNSSYTTVDLDFVKDTYWDEFLGLYLN